MEREKTDWGSMCEREARMRDAWTFCMLPGSRCRIVGNTCMTASKDASVYAHPQLQVEKMMEKLIADNGAGSCETRR